MNAALHQRLHTKLVELERNPGLAVADNVIERIQALDWLDFDLLETLDFEKDAGENVGKGDAEFVALHQRAQALKARLQAVDDGLISYLVTSIRASDFTAFQRLMQRARHQVTTSPDMTDIGYDELDAFVASLLAVPTLPEDIQSVRDPEMVYYQTTPARIVLKLLDALDLTSDDVFYDLGAGLGHVPILVYLLTGMPTHGVEVEAAYVRYATESRDKLGLSSVGFTHADARQADYHGGTVFYLYTPFHGAMLQQVLSRLEVEAQRRPIRVCTYGPCRGPVSEQLWLEATYQTGSGEDALAIFRSR